VFEEQEPANWRLVPGLSSIQVGDRALLLAPDGTKFAGRVNSASGTMVTVRIVMACDLPLPPGMESEVTVTRP